MLWGSPERSKGDLVVGPALVAVGQILLASVNYDDSRGLFVASVTLFVVCVVRIIAVLTRPDLPVPHAVVTRALRSATAAARPKRNPPSGWSTG